MNADLLPRPFVPDNEDRGSGRLVHAGAQTYRSPLRQFGSVHCRSVCLLAPLLKSPVWAIICAAEPAEIHRFRMNGYGTVGVVAEVLTADRLHVSWMAALFTFSSTEPARSLAEFVLEDAENHQSVTALVGTTGGCHLVAPGVRWTVIGNINTIAEAEATLTRTLTGGWCLELIGTAFPTNQLGAMSYLASGWVWVSGSPLIVPQRRIPHGGDPE